MAAILRALCGYLFLVFITRVVGRRPGKQITPFEFILLFFMGGLALIGMIGNDASVSNAMLEIMVVGLAHYCIAWLRHRSPRYARFTDGTPMILLEHGEWRTKTLIHMRIQDDDVMAMARDNGVSRLDQIERAILERNGEITIAKKS